MQVVDRGQIVEYRLPDGRGARFFSNGMFDGLLDPYATQINALPNIVESSEIRRTPCSPTAFGWPALKTPKSAGRTKYKVAP